MAIEKEIKNLKFSRAAVSGFEFSNWPIIKPIPGKEDFEINMTHWEYIPPSIHDEFELKEARKLYTWLNAKGENLFINEKGKLSMYREGALYGRCLALSTGFYEYQHIPKIGKKGQELKATEGYPYRIGVANRDEPFYMAAVSRVWTNHLRGQSADTFAIVTTHANDRMQQVHNTKKRMPVILPEELAWEWLFGNLDQRRILELASYQYDSEEMYFYTVSKTFLTDDDPTLEVEYENVPPIL